VHTVTGAAHALRSALRACHPPLEKVMDEQRLIAFLASVQRIDWLSHAGESCDEARVVRNIQDGWDGENERMLEVWAPRTHALEAQAEGVLGDQTITDTFARVSETIHSDLYKGMCSYFDRIYGETDNLQRSVDESLYIEVMDSIKRDVCWAAIEDLIQAHAFFTGLLHSYRNGRWPCSWDGEYPQGRAVVL
jgi:hypothetical protein